MLDNVLILMASIELIVFFGLAVWLLINCPLWRKK